ncbi:hypothetical protein BpHYR1_011200 [Brachionus plicatilis]|uniref:Uncharacterized protein n=1 Tax=Brachionus plicatilis TaxID=10195 RepID=A0A3M7SP16_BRAPC|nr:hypothetical protein BpHYR1_011200 [Brachionus plicatilis]
MDAKTYSSSSSSLSPMQHCQLIREFLQSNIPTLQINKLGLRYQFARHNVLSLTNDAYVLLEIIVFENKDIFSKFPDNKIIH